MKIYAPVKDFNGWRNTVRFIKGVGETDDLTVIEWFKSNGYILEKCDKSIETPVEKCDEPIETDENSEPDFDAMTPNEIREWMQMNGYGSKMKNIRSKDKLLEIIRG